MNDATEKLQWHTKQSAKELLKTQKNLKMQIESNVETKIDFTNSKIKLLQPGPKSSKSNENSSLENSNLLLLPQDAPVESCSCLKKFIQTTKLSSINPEKTVNILGDNIKTTSDKMRFLCPKLSNYYFKVINISDQDNTSNERIESMGEDSSETEKENTSKTEKENGSKTEKENGSKTEKENGGKGWCNWNMDDWCGSNSNGETKVQDALKKCEKDLSEAKKKVKDLEEKIKALKNKKPPIVITTRDKKEKEKVFKENKKLLKDIKKLLKEETESSGESGKNKNRPETTSTSEGSYDEEVLIFKPKNRKPEKLITVVKMDSKEMKHRAKYKAKPGKDPKYFYKIKDDSTDDTDFIEYDDDIDEES